MVQYDVRTLNHGNEKGFYSTINVVDDKVAFEAPKILTGLTGTSDFTPEQKSSNFYADNQVHVGGVTTGVKSVDDAKIKLLQIPADFANNHLGFKVDKRGGLTDTGLRKAFAFGFVQKIADENGGEDEQLTVYYNVKFNSLSKETNTDEDEVKETVFELSVSASPSSAVKDDAGKDVYEYTVLKSKFVADGGNWDDIFNGSGVLPVPEYTPATNSTPAG